MVLKRILVALCVILALMACVSGRRSRFILPASSTKVGNFVIKVNVDLGGWQDDWLERSSFLEDYMRTMQFQHIPKRL